MKKKKKKRKKKGCELTWINWWSLAVECGWARKILINLAPLSLFTLLMFFPPFPITAPIWEVCANNLQHTSPPMAPPSFTAIASHTLSIASWALDTSRSSSPPCSNEILLSTAPDPATLTTRWSDPGAGTSQWIRVPVSRWMCDTTAASFPMIPRPGKSGMRTRKDTCPGASFVAGRLGRLRLNGSSASLV